jgi:hypothetical protein
MDGGEERDCRQHWLGFNLTAVGWTGIGFLISTLVPALLTSLIAGAGYALTIMLQPNIASVVRHKP